MVDVLLLSVGATAGLREADLQLERSLAAAGAEVVRVEVPAPDPVHDRLLVPALPRVDLRWARATRRTARAELARLEPRSVVYCTTTATLLWPAPGAVRFDAAASSNRPGPVGLWQRPLERRRLRQASLLIPSSHEALRDSPWPDAPAVVVPVPVEPSGPPPDGRDLAAITYANLPWKKGLDRVLAAWHEVRRPGERLVVAGNEEPVSGEGVESVGRLPPERFRALLRRSRVFVTAPRREDYGIVQLEALSDGCVLVTTPSEGAYVALPIARRLDERLVSDRLGGALRAALDSPRIGYAERAREELAPFRTPAVDEIVARELLPRLLRN
jgi:hypothetical protein